MPRRIVPVVHDAQGAEDPVHVAGPRHVAARRADREAPRALEFRVDLPRGAVFGRQGVDGPGRIVHRVAAVILEGVGDDLRGVRLEAHRVHVDRGGKGQEGAHAERGDGSAVGAGRTAVRRRRGPTESPRVTIIVIVAAVEVHLECMADRSTGHELPEADRPADRREHGAAVGAGVTGPQEVLVLLGPHDRRRATRGATGHRLALDERVAVGGQDRGRIVRRRAVRVPRPGSRHDEVRRDGGREQDAALGAASAAAVPGIAVVVDRRAGGVRGQDEDVDVRRHAVCRGLLDVPGDVDGARADREVPDAVPGEGPREGVADDRVR